MKQLLFSIFIFNIGICSAQFAGVAGSANTSAMHTDSSAFITWASKCNITRGYQDISNTSLGYANIGDSTYAVGKADAGIVSLGDGGMATVTFSAPITNGPGYDFAVFENAFNDSFLELAFVEVSSDGTNYVRFPTICNLPVSPQFDNNANMDASKINNLAGKYRSLYGTPFDLQELSGNALLDISAVTHIRIIDVVGNINSPFARFDSQNHVINDPWPTPYPSSGFDLDAVGVIHQKAVGVDELSKHRKLNVYPNPANDKLTILFSAWETGQVLTIKNTLGTVIKTIQITSSQHTIDINEFTSGLYFVSIQTKHGEHTIKLIKE